MDAVSALRLQLEWGVDEALLPAPVVCLRASGPPSAPPALADQALADRAPAPPARRAAGSAASPSSGTGRELARAAATVADLAAALRGFDPNGLAATATSLVWDPSASPAALALLGDVPGAEEDRAGMPFAGPAGALLDRMLASIGLDRAEVMLAHLIPWRPPGGRPTNPAELAAYLPFLARQLALRGVARVLLLGTGPVKALLGRDLTLARARGGWRTATLDDPPGTLPALATFAPGQLLERSDLKPGAWADLRRLRRTLLDK